MNKRLLVVTALALTLAGAGCGVAYQASTELRASRMQRDLKAGESKRDVRNAWGEPDLRQDLSNGAEVWSYAKRANSNDIAASLLYTNVKEGDKGDFLDLTFVDGKLASWKEAVHTMPAKTGGPGFSFGVGPSATTGSVAHY
ncbi:MAG TPA: hypothetical protein VFB33_14500 [Candidatus Binataceae bacterium]|nr:hypothetical protein [Candidatus Binataceae bacterium]